MPTRLPILIVFLLAACGPIVLYPTTDGFHTALPSPQTRVIVWGTHPTVEATATTWLQKRGLTILASARLRQAVSDQGVPLTRTRRDEALVLRAGDSLGADLVVFAEGAVRASATTGTHDARLERDGHAHVIDHAHVSVRAVSLKSNEIVWGGSARMSQHYYGTVDESLTHLTCQALATAWALRPPGLRRIASHDMCEVQT